VPCHAYVHIFIAATNEVLYGVTKERMGHEMLKEFPHILSLESNRLLFGDFLFYEKNLLFLIKNKNFRYLIPARKIK
jgi:hypothetical protein